MNRDGSSEVRSRGAVQVAIYPSQYTLPRNFPYAHNAQRHSSAITASPPAPPTNISPRLPLLRMRKTFSPWQPINKMAADEVCSVAAELVQLAISQSVEELTENKSSTSNVSWPSSGEFTVEGGQRAVEKTVQVTNLWPS